MWVQVTVSTADVQKVLIHQDPSRAAIQIRRPWQDKPFSLGDFIQVSAESYHKGKEGFVTNVKNDGDDVIYDLRLTCRLSGEPASFMSVDTPVDELIVSEFD